MANLINLTGKQFYKLTVIGFPRKIGKYYQWLCRCACGKERYIYGSSLREGKIKSCGCEWHTAITAHTHGMAHTRAYRVWKSMIQRCENPSDHAYKNYGGRGIKIASTIRSFENFYALMGDRPKGMTLDRIENNKGYEPGNLHWASPKEQGRNSRKNHLLSYQGKTQCISAWAEDTGLTKACIDGRLRLGWDTKLILSRPMRQLKPRKSKTPIGVPNTGSAKDWPASTSPWIG